MGGKTIQERIADVIAKTCTDYVDAYRMDEKTAQILTRVLAAEFGIKHAYAPATHIVVSRECAGDVLGLLDAWADRLNAVEHKPTWGIVPDFDPSVTELRAALEGEHE